MQLTEKEINDYLDEAIALTKNAYVRYSHFPVAALVIDDKGNKHKGVNVENASYGLAICAERNAITTAITEGMKRIKLLVVVADTKQPGSPCGACRQVISEFSDDETVILLGNMQKVYKLTNIKELLPYAFTPDDLL